MFFLFVFNRIDFFITQCEYLDDHDDSDANELFSFSSIRCQDFQSFFVLYSLFRRVHDNWLDLISKILPLLDFSSSTELLFDIILSPFAILSLPWSLSVFFPLSYSDAGSQFHPGNHEDYYDTDDNDGSN